MAKQRRFWIWTLAILVGAGVLYAAFQADDVVSQWQRAHRWRHHPQASRVITHLTDWPVHVAVGLALAAFAWLRGNRRWSAIFLSMVLAAALAGVVAYGIKVTVGRPRPAVKIERTWERGDFRPNHHAFPSGHAAASAAFFAVLLFVCWRLGILLLVPLGVGATRIFLGAHYLSDVVGGLLLGLLIAALVARFLPPRRVSA